MSNIKHLTQGEFRQVREYVALRLAGRGSMGTCFPSELIEAERLMDHGLIDLDHPNLRTEKDNT